MSKDKDRHGYVYFIMSGDHIKIGFSRDPMGRMADLQISTSSKLHMLAFLPGTMSDEKWLHDIFDDLRIHGEWFLYQGALARYINDAISVSLPSWDEPKPAVPRGEALAPAKPLTPEEIAAEFGEENFRLLSELHQEFAEGVTLRALALQLIRDGRVHPRNQWMTYGLRASLKAEVCKANYIIACAINGFEATQ